MLHAILLSIEILLEQVAHAMISIMMFLGDLEIKFVNLAITVVTIVLLQELQRAQTVIYKLLIIGLSQFIQANVIAILGKGHETGQEIAGVKHPFDDRKILAEAIAGKK